MKESIIFEGISKQYRLGLTRTSLPVLITDKLKNIARNKGKPKNNGNKYIWALKDVSFKLMPGSSLALIGPNGAGKTTVLKILANITKPTSGNFEINGRLSALIELGAGFHSDLTGRENIYLNAKILGLKRYEIQKVFDEIVSFSGLEGFLDTPLKRYSSGMSVRLGFSVAAFIQPEILLVDEVLAVGDAQFRQKCISRIHELIKSGASLILVSHNLWLVQAIADKAIYIDKGKIVCEGETQKVIETYDRKISIERIKDNKFENLDKINTEGIEIERIQIVGPDSTLKQDFFNNKPVQINLHYFAYHNFYEANAVIRIIRSDGVTCCMVRTKIDKFLFILNAGRGILSLTLDPIQLYGGAFYIQAIIRDATDSYSIVSGYSDWFYVKGSVLSHHEMQGVFEPNRHWDHHKID